MNTALCLHNATVITGFSVMENCAVYIKNNRIADVFSERRLLQKQLTPTAKIINAEGAYVAPGFIDSHIHGIGGYGTDDYDADSILQMSKILARYGVTSFIPTLYSAPEKEMTQGIKAIVKAMGHEKGAHILGMHLEGPFISPERLGVQSPSSISPVDLNLMKRLWKASKGKIINMTLAPELKHTRELALFCIEQGIIMQAGHTNATYQNMLEGMQVRIMHTTHLFNAMSRMHHRDPGAVGAVLIHPELSCEFIADGIHIDPNLIKLLVKDKPSDKLVVVTDSLKPTKQKADKLYANNEEVYLDKCFYRKSDNVIAGSAMTMIDSVKNLVSWGLSVEQAVQMSSANPAQILKIPNKGIIAPGFDADLVVFNQDFHIMHTILNGQIYQEK